MRRRANAGASRRGMSRRAALKLAAAGLGVGALPWVPGRALAGEQALMFTWGGYELPGFDKVYIEEHGEGPEFILFGDEDEAFAKVASGFHPDIAHPCSSIVKKWKDAGLIEAIDTSRLSNWPDVFPILANLPGTRFDGEQYFVPWDWGSTSVTYRTDLVDIEEESFGLLWDERYAGKLAVIDSAGDTALVAAIYAGFDPYHMTLDQIAQVKELLARQKPLLRMYTNDLTTVEQALASGELVAALTWNESPINLAAEGVPVKYMEPKEGALTWCCGFVLIKDPPHRDLAYDLIDSRLDPSSGQYNMSEYGYGHSNAKSFDLFTDDELIAKGLPTDPTAMLEKGHIGPLPDHYEEIVRMFEEMKAGF